MSIQLAIIGPHGAGKTTVGRAVADRLGWRFDDEIGRRLREAALAQDPGAHALIAQAGFDGRVLRTELARDRTAVVDRVVETWHPGNLAYAYRRSPEVAAAWFGRVRASLRGSRATFVQPLRISLTTARERLSEPGPDPDTLVRFFRDVGEEAERVATVLGLRVLPGLDTDHASVERLADEIAERVIRGVARQVLGA